jgi:hypothetical protein
MTRMSLFSHNKRKRRQPEWVHGFAYRVTSAEAPRIHFSAESVEQAKRRQAARIAARAGAEHPQPAS